MKRVLMNRKNWVLCGFIAAFILLASWLEFRAFLAGAPYTKKCRIHGSVMRRCYFHWNDSKASHAGVTILYGPGYDICEYQVDRGNWRFWCPQAPPKSGWCP